MMKAGSYYVTQAPDCSSIVMEAEPKLSRWTEQGSKRVMDFTVAVLLVILALPLLLLIALLVASDRSSVLYTHRRVGRNGIAFNCVKFRTMRPNTDAKLAADPAKRAEWETTRKLRHNPRITWIGRFLRAIALINCRRNCSISSAAMMSLVGPGPVTADERNIYYNGRSSVAREAYPSVRPRYITGLWQISGRSQAGYDERVRFDEHYARTGSFSTDVAVLGRTFVVVVQCKGAL